MPQFRRSSPKPRLTIAVNRPPIRIGLECRGRSVKKLVIYAGIAAIALVAAPASAADVEIGAPPPYYGRPLPPPPLMFTWTGCYLGGHFGGAFLNNNFTDLLLEDTAVPSTFGAPTTADLISRSNSFGSNGFLVGGQAGCDYQLPWRWVIGFEGNAAWANITGGQRLTGSATLLGILPGANTTVNSNGNLSLKTDFIATATARLGYAVGFLGQGLIYAKGGAAWVGNRYEFDGQDATTSCAVVQLSPPQCTSFNPTVINPFSFNASETRLGWTVGVGVEWAVLRYWSIKGEYNFMDFGSHTVTFTDPLFGGGLSVNVKQQVNEVKLGINFRFGPEFIPMY
jgi:outer membrane immunogenic protein